MAIRPFRLRGHYFALAMLAYPLTMLYVFQWLGYQEVSLPMKRDAPLLYMQFADQRAYVVLALGLLVVALAVSLGVENSRFGMALLAIKQNEPAAEAAGIDTWRWKMRAIMLSGALAGMAGGLYAVVLLVVTPESVFGMLVSAQPLILALFGGVGSLWGPVIGAVVLVPLAEGLNGELGDVLPGIQGVVYGVAIILIILGAPEGVYWHLRDRFAKSRSAPLISARARPRRRPLGCTADWPRRSPGAAWHRDLVWRAARARPCRSSRAGRQPTRPHRPQRRRQDDIVQCRQWLSGTRCRRDQLWPRSAHWAAAEPGVPARHWPHFSSGACISAHDGARKRGRGCVCRHV